jgi:prepilin-type N-terminal cleavage/methylation domain-containing protein
MKILSKQKNSGFTLIETMVAVFILTIALSSLLSLNASSIFSSRYAKNEIVANYLLQEAIDYIRNDRDTIAFQQNNMGDGWNAFLSKYSACTGVGCYFEPALFSTAIIQTCSFTPIFGVLSCPILNYDDTASNNDFYTYQTGIGIPSNFKRQILMSRPSPDELDVKVTVEWLNGNLVRSRFLQTTLMKWQ